MADGTWRFDRDLVVPEMDAIVAWLAANDVTPGDVPLDARVRIAGGQLTVDVFLKRDGKHYIGSSGKPARSIVTVPLRQPAPRLRSLKRDGATP